MKLLLLLLPITIFAQKVTFDNVDVLLWSSNSDPIELSFKREGSFEYSKENKKFYYNSGTIQTSLNVLKEETSDLKSIILYCENGYTIILFEDQFFIRKIYTNKKYIFLIEQRMYSLTFKI